MNNESILTHSIGDLVLDYDSNNQPILGYIISYFEGKLGKYYEVEWLKGVGYMYYGSDEIIKMKGKLFRFKQDKKIG
jgi:hypothetical protein